MYHMLSDAVKRHRAKKGLSQDKLSKLAGVTLATLVKIESGANDGTIPARKRCRPRVPSGECPLSLLLLAFNNAAVWHPLASNSLDHGPADSLAELLPAFWCPRIREERGNELGSARGERAPDRPDVQSGDMPMAHVLFMDGVERRLLQRKRVLD
jgi:DNA-binding XRE family transcriptional regulator